MNSARHVLEWNSIAQQGTGGLSQLKDQMVAAWIAHRTWQTVIFGQTVEGTLTTVDYADRVFFTLEVFHGLKILYITGPFEQFFPVEEKAVMTLEQFQLLASTKYATVTESRYKQMREEEREEYLEFIAFSRDMDAPYPNSELEHYYSLRDFARTMRFAGVIESEETMFGCLPDGHLIYVGSLGLYESAPQEQREDPCYWHERFLRGDFDDPENAPSVWVSEETISR